jgi:hypothetical protein
MQAGFLITFGAWRKSLRCYIGCMAELVLKSLSKSHLKNGEVQIILGSYFVNGDGHKCLSAACASYAEVAESVENLKGQLDRILREAKRKFPTR